MFTKGENQLGKALYQDDHYKECFPHNRATATTTTTDLHQGYPFQMHKESRIIETWKKTYYEDLYLFLLQIRKELRSLNMCENYGLELPLSEDVVILFDHMVALAEAFKRLRALLITGNRPLAIADFTSGFKRVCDGALWSIDDCQNQ
ncbi:unnamed protein product [Rhizophagus irregularis]|uniref:Uncharacterized protein n=1 Tax=Rhizophagus irregularis TaxID=588596 RepID=A0A915ZCC2_9GLOM|nr:unnamed protein product [Rhizophagus irregularis]CAB5115283.1 unnamed protein product [Rhizophagus irregularis]CAB5369210.1 unnamed protein product [Rhizophagus irregularis]